MSFRKEQLVKGVVWSGIDKVGMVAIQLLLELVLARYVLPIEYGIIGLAMIFISLGTLFSESGFANALIHNQDRTEVDFSTAFYFNFLIALSVVLVVVLTAPYIAIFFNTPILAKVLKLISLCIIFNSLVMVHKTKLSISMDFKTQAKITFISLILSGIISVMMAINGYGVWALVVQILSQSIFTFLLFSVFNFWKPLPVFSRNSFKKLFGFGSHVLLAGIIQSIYINLYNLLIGKRMSTVTLGLYTKSNQFTLFPAGLVS
ncbi:MAG: oligosaccharide flippase family protein, partial [Chryseobacterium sp.]|nr:oligosaccharide flippase family protein [Chryseobacterium sp.]